MKTDFIVIGSGLAGLTCALTLAKSGKVLLLSKNKLNIAASSLAQGGIAAVVSPGDSFESHIRDTLEAGAFHNKKSAVEYLVKNAPAAIKFLEENGVMFEKNGGFMLGREAAHSFPRILHATDFTGREIENALIKRVRGSKNIAVWEDSFATDLIVKDGKCYGVQVLKSYNSSVPNFSGLHLSSDLGSPAPISTLLPNHSDTGRGRPPKLVLSELSKLIECFARATILATGGLGQIYKWTTNPEVATGDGYAMARRAGAKLSDMEFIQFHPTALKNGNSPLFLLSEAIRGEGAYLVNDKGERFMEKVDKRGELAPRDIVAREVYRQQREGDVYLDIRHKTSEFLKKRFPNIYAELLKRGFDMAVDLLPVTAAAHYSCGGVPVDLFGRTDTENLFAFGEVSRTGVHGANRLASNSLLEAVVFPLRLEKIISQLPEEAKEIPTGEFTVSEIKGVVVGRIKNTLKDLMWKYAGIERTEAGLKAASDELEKTGEELRGLTMGSPETLEVKNMVLTAKSVVSKALARKKSLGAHFIY